MTIRKTLTAIVLAGALALGSIGCKYNAEYEYNGKIGEENITFKEQGCVFGSNLNTLTVIKADGRVIKYVDYIGNDSKLEYVDIIKDGQINSYSDDDEVGDPVLKVAQKQFDAYLQKIKETKINQGLTDLK